MNRPRSAEITGEWRTTGKKAAGGEEDQEAVRQVPQVGAGSGDLLSGSHPDRASALRIYCNKNHWRSRGFLSGLNLFRYQCEGHFRPIKFLESDVECPQPQEEYPR